ncbi:MAG: serine/threonine-protein kinase [Gemmatimonadaceae bacterium]|nr:serine/threonine-protein kinase [Gemmatimonadaceae bacterium]
MTAMFETLRAALADRYQLLRELGAGGMATVYLARDLKHERDVAIKVLKPELAAVLGAERFVQEIRTTAQLQHPHILPLFDSGVADGFLYYVMPYIEGETIREQLHRETQVAVEDAVRLTREVADALDYAHRRGIIHRDIKPENILLHDGRAMVMDFGIALAVSAAAGGRMTETGLSLGTPHYMSPEQATADKELTPRSDVYSLATVCYEMLAGEPPHLGNSAQQIIMKIITEPAAPVAKLRRTVPAHVNAALETALEKLPADRFATAKAFADALANPAYVRDAAAPRVTTAVAPVRSRWRDPVVWGALAVAVSAVAGLLSSWPKRGGTVADNGSVTRVILATAPGQDFIRGATWRDFDLSSDGRFVVYVGHSPAGPAVLWKRSLDALEATVVPGSEGVSGTPRISTDLRRVAVRRRDRLVVLPLDGGTAQELGLAPTSLKWGDDGAIYFRDDATVLYRWMPGAPAADSLFRLGGRQLTEVLPGSRRFLVSNGGQSLLGLLDLDRGINDQFGTGTSPRFVPPNWLLYTRPSDRSIVVQRFDPASGRPDGEARVTGDAPSPLGMFTVAADGSLLYERAAVGSDSSRLVWLDRKGVTTAIGWIAPQAFDAPALSPDGTRIAVALPTSRGIQSGDLWVYDLRQQSRLPFGRDGLANRPSWHPDGRHLLYVSAEAENAFLQEIAVDGSGTSRRLTTLSSALAEGFWSRDAKEIVIRMPGVTVRNIFRFVPGVDTKPTPVLNEGVAEHAPALSPDGRWLAYATDRPGRKEVFIRPHPGGGAPIVVSLEGGHSPLWSPDGTRLLYVSADSAFWEARLRSDGGTLSVESRTRLFKAPPNIVLDQYRPHHAWAPDGRILAVQRTPRADGRQNDYLVLVRGWLQSVTAPPEVRR